MWFNHKKTYPKKKSQFKSILEDIWPVCLKTVKVIEKQESLRHCNRKEKSKQIFDIKCGVLGQIPGQNRKR
jgi:hypothetical protein